MSSGLAAKSLCSYARRKTFKHTCFALGELRYLATLLKIEHTATTTDRELWEQLSTHKLLAGKPESDWVYLCQKKNRNPENHHHFDRLGQIQIDAFLPRAIAETCNDRIRLEEIMDSVTALIAGLPEAEQKKIYFIPNLSNYVRKSDSGTYELNAKKKAEFIQNCEIIIIICPTHELHNKIERRMEHYTCVVVFKKLRKIEFFDSLGHDLKAESNQPILHKLKPIVSVFVTQKNKYELSRREIPIQKGGTQCGMFVLLYIKFRVFDGLTFNQTYNKLEALADEGCAAKRKKMFLPHKTVLQKDLAPVEAENEGHSPPKKRAKRSPKK